MTPLVLVHGFMGGSAQWIDIEPKLRSHRDLIAVDLPGFGSNADLHPIDSIGGFADWVIAELRRQGVDQYHLLGHSMGGMIAQEIARRDKTGVDRLILYATGAVGALPSRFETIEESKIRAKTDGARATARRIAATWFLEQDTAQGFEHCAQVAECTSLNAVLAGLDAMRAWSGVDRLSQISQETLIIWGDRDRTYAWDQIDRLWKKIPKTNLAVLPGYAHAVHAENPELFCMILTDFLEARRFG